MQEGMNWPRGLLKLVDEYGIDQLVETLEDLRERSGWVEYKPHPLLYKMVEEGRVGLASGSGFYEHEQLEIVEYERQEYAAWVMLNRPDKPNALDKASWEGLKAALERSTADNHVRMTILRDGGRPSVEATTSPRY